MGEFFKFKNSEDCFCHVRVIIGSNCYCGMQHNSRTRLQYGFGEWFLELSHRGVVCPQRHDDWNWH